MKAKPYTSKELSGLYNISAKTLQTWLKPLQDQLGKRNGHFYSVKQVKIIFENMGEPC